MALVATVDLTHYLFMIPLMLLSIFMVLVILVQRGRGGGLTGALGGMGGQSAFGTKAGDLFTRITIVVAAIWVILSMASLKVLNKYSDTVGLDPGARGQAVPATKTGEGGLLPSATKSGDAATGITPEADPAGTAPSVPATGGAIPEAPASATPSPAPAATTADAAAKAADSAKPSDSAKP